MPNIFNLKARFLNRTSFYVQLASLTYDACCKMNIHIAFPDKPVYLERYEGGGNLLQKNQKETSFELSLSPVSDCFTDTHDILLFPNILKANTDTISNYIKSAIRSQKLLREITQKYACNVSLSTFTDIDSNQDAHEKIYRGVCVFAHHSDKKFSANDVIKMAYENNLKRHYFIKLIKEGKCRVEERDSETMGVLSDHIYIVKDSWGTFEKCRSITQCQSRAFSKPDLCPVFHSYVEARKILSKCKDMPEAITLLDIADKNIPGNFDVNELQNQIQHPFVVVEGLDATGKTTLTETLEKKLNAVRYYTPPPEVAHLRKFFDALPEIIRRAYYCIGNYIVAIQIARECQNKAVIMDRFWHSTTAYGVANETSTSDMPPSGHWVYQWPSDLLKPTLVLFLTVTEEVRRQRLSGRGGAITFEEQHLDKDILFRQRLCEAYRRMENPVCIEIDAKGSKESVVKTAEETLEKHGIKL
ncbi:UMP-CMP kinase 2, mitochondrial-like [Mytilus galloprovincialis]|uniref:UMP-CMP kinase 2, mitochondrial n=1 Tax=Mytilus galloprovincialis TaxID=29158 RepID=A0A8B6CN96_MYTGA|nr:UMP-CMP kinase 2, mitochondrial [Mytilus galloprovincialis]